MHIKSKSHTNKMKIIIISLLSALLILGGVATWYFLRNGAHSDDRPENTVDYNSATNEQKEAGARAKQEFIDRIEGSSSDTGQPNASGQDNYIKIIISSSNQDGQMYQIRTIISTIASDGSCTLELTKSGVGAITQVVDIQPQGAYSVCKGFDIPLESMQKGTWQARVSYKGISGQGIAEKEIEIQ